MSDKPAEAHNSLVARRSSYHSQFISRVGISCRKSDVDHHEHHPSGFAHQGDIHPDSPIPPLLELTDTPPLSTLLKPPNPDNPTTKGGPLPHETSQCDVFLKAYEDIKSKVYAKCAQEPVADDQPTTDGPDYTLDESTHGGGLLKVSPSKPGKSGLDDLSAYIQNQLEGKNGGEGIKKSAKQQLVPIPLRYRRPLKAKSREKLQPLRKTVKNEDPALFEFTFPDENPLKHHLLFREFMGRGDHRPPPLELKHVAPGAKEGDVSGKTALKFSGHFQQIFPEDPNWKLGIIERLSEICLQTILDHFQDMPYQIAALPVEMQQRFLPELPVVSETNLYLASDYFHNENYWERSCRSRWGKATFPHPHGSWKLTYIERSFQDMIENYVPLQSDPNILLNDLLNIGEYVLKLTVTQLLPPVRHTFGDFAAMVEAQLANHMQFTDPSETTQMGENQTAAVRKSSIAKVIPLADGVKSYLDPTGAVTDHEFPGVKQNTWSDKAKLKFQRLVTQELNLNRGVDKSDKLMTNMTRELDDIPAHSRTINPFLAADHMNLVPVTANMPHLMDLELRYGVKECGMNFSWRLFQFTLNDAKRLAEALIITPSLRRLCLANCRIDDVKGAIVCQALLDHPNLAILELQCNELGAKTATVISRMIKRSEVLNKVDLGENLLGDEGAKLMAKSLVRGVSLRILNLRMNKIGDVGAEALFLVTKSCITFLQQLVLSSNQITGKIVNLLTETMKVNRRLEKYDLSVNELEGVNESRKLQEALTQSYHIQEFWLQENKFPVDFEACIEELLGRNQEARLKQVLLDIENNYDFDIRKIKFPTESAVMSSDSDDDSSGSWDALDEEDDGGEEGEEKKNPGSAFSTDNEVGETTEKVVSARK